MDKVNTAGSAAKRQQHPSHALIARAHDAFHSHPARYHAFIFSPYRNAKLLPELQDNAITAQVLHDKLLGWFASVKDDRAMPWRKELDLDRASRQERSQRGYEVWVSEIMLQQTQVATVIAYFNRWMQVFPTVSALASANIDSVNEIWSGLGYYSRASRLLSGAQKVVSDFDGRLPESVEDLLKIDGIGPYSAGAISSIAFGQRSALVDGNVTRVLSRLTAFHAPPAAKASTSYIWAVADSLVPQRQAGASGTENQPGNWNQALMELGATVCTPKTPQCSVCPLSLECLAFAEAKHRKAQSIFSKAQVAKKIETDIEDLCQLCTPFDASGKVFDVAQYPQAKEKKAIREEETAVCVLEHEGSGKLLLVKRPEKGLLAGLYDFVAVDLPPTKPSTPASRTLALDGALSDLVAPNLPSLGQGLKTEPPPSAADIIVRSSTDLASIEHVYSHQKREYHIVHAVIATTSGPEPPALAKASRARWVSRTDIGQKEKGITLGGAMGRVLDIVKAGRNKDPFKRRTSALKSGEKKVDSAAAGAKKGKRGKAREADEMDDFLVDEDEEEGEAPKKRGTFNGRKRSSETAENATLIQVAVSPTRKRPRIVISSDDD